MDAALAEIPIIDVDTHFTEPPDLWTSRAPASLRDRAPRVERDGSGNLHWVVERDIGLGPPGFCVIRPDGSKAHGIYSLPSFEEMTPAATETAPRLAAMDALGLHTQILYPNVMGFAGSFIMRVEDVALRNFCVTAYNDAVAGLQAESGGRLRPQALLPFWDARLAVAELVRCHEDLGLAGFVISDSPELFGLPTLSEPFWEGLWSTAEERGLPVNFHIGGGGLGGGIWQFEGAQGRKIAALSTLAQLSNMRCIVNLIFSGLLDRHPALKFVSVESGVGWLPFLLESAEYQVDENGADLALRPREYFRRQIYASFWFERENVARAIEWIGEDNVMFETDFPHPTCLYPAVAEQVQAVLGGRDPALQRKVLWQNAARVYQLPAPVTAG